MTHMNKMNNLSWRRIIAAFALVAFLLNSGIVPLSYVHAQEVFQLALPGSRVSLSPAFIPPLLTGVKVYPDNPFRLDFILDKGDGAKALHTMSLPSESSRLIKYFLASLTVPEKDLWVNLSPYEKDRIVPDAFGITEMGRDLLAQDYLLKQITASVIYPEDKVGKEFWAKVYSEAERRYGTTNIPVDTFNKVWIVPAKAVIYENKDSAYVVESRLKVLLEEDYLALEKNQGSAVVTVKDQDSHNLGSEIIREVVIPILEKEVNDGKNFAQLRQVYHSLILAIWFKDKIKDTIFGKAYVDQQKVGGVDIVDKAAREKIWAQYVEAFKKGAYNYIKEDIDPVTKQSVPRKYFSGGAGLYRTREVLSRTTDRSQLPEGISDRAMVVKADLVSVDASMDAENEQNVAPEKIERISQALTVVVRQEMGEDINLAKSVLIKDLDVKTIPMLEDVLKKQTTDFREPFNIRRDIFDILKAIKKPWIKDALLVLFKLELGLFKGRNLYNHLYDYAVIDLLIESTNITIDEIAELYIFINDESYYYRNSQLFERIERLSTLIKSATIEEKVIFIIERYITESRERVWKVRSSEFGKEIERTYNLPSDGLREPDLTIIDKLQLAGFHPTVHSQTVDVAGRWEHHTLYRTYYEFKVPSEEVSRVNQYLTVNGLNTIHNKELTPDMKEDPRILVLENLVLNYSKKKVEAITSVFSRLNKDYDKKALADAYTEFWAARMKKKLRDEEGRFHIGDRKQFESYQTSDDKFDPYVKRTDAHPFLSQLKDKYGIAGGYVEQERHAEDYPGRHFYEVAGDDYLVVPEGYASFIEMYLLLGEKVVEQVLKPLFINRGVNRAIENELRMDSNFQSLYSFIESRGLVFRPDLKY